MRFAMANMCTDNSLPIEERTFQSALFSIWLELRTFKAALRVRKLRFSSIQERGKALAGPIWQVAITQMLGDDDDAKFHEFMEKLLHRPRKHPSDGRVVSMLESASRFFSPETRPEQRDFLQWTWTAVPEPHC